VKKLLESLVVVVSLIVFVLFLFVFVLDWTGGCGETYEYANGTLHQGECVGREFLNSYIKEVFK
jgi:hypothetical protein